LYVRIPQGLQVVCFYADVDVRILKGLQGEILHVQNLQELLFGPFDQP